MKKHFHAMLYMSLLIIAGAANANDLSKKVVSLNAVSNEGIQQVTFRDKEGVCHYSGESIIKKQSPSLMSFFSATEKTMLISISSKNCNAKITPVKLYASPDQERLNTSISVFGTSSKTLIPQGSEFYLTEKKTELSWNVKN